MEAPLDKDRTKVKTALEDLRRVLDSHTKCLLNETTTENDIPAAVIVGFLIIVGFFTIVGAGRRRTGYNFRPPLRGPTLSREKPGNDIP